MGVDYANLFMGEIQKRKEIIFPENKDKYTTLIPQITSKLKKIKDKNVTLLSEIFILLKLTLLSKISDSL